MILKTIFLYTLWWTHFRCLRVRSAYGSPPPFTYVHLFGQTPVRDARFGAVPAFLYVHQNGPTGLPFAPAGLRFAQANWFPPALHNIKKRCDSKPQRYLSHHCSNAASPTFSHSSWPCCNRIATACHFAKLRCNKSVPETVTKHRLQYLCSKLQQIKPMFNRRLLQLLSQLNQRISRHNCHITFQWCGGSKKSIRDRDTLNATPPSETIGFIGRFASRVVSIADTVLRAITVPRTVSMALRPVFDRLLLAALAARSWQSTGLSSTALTGMLSSSRQTKPEGHRPANRRSITPSNKSKKKNYSNHIV